MNQGGNAMNKFEANEANVAPGTRRPYVKPAFECERVFETTALTCSFAEKGVDLWS
jgi:hypothetical protein